MTTRKKVLIVEDNEPNMKLFRDLLEVHGIDTIEAFDGLKVLDIAKEQSPDLILMDIQLPQLSGLDVTKMLKADEELKKIPVIALTAFVMKVNKEDIMKAGCDEYLSKPISINKLIETIQKYI